MKLKKIESLEQIEKVIREFNDTFNPSTSSIVGNLKAYSNKICKHAITIVAIDDSRIVGYASFYCNDSTNFVAYLSQIAVKEEYRGLGIGDMILKKIEEICLTNNMKFLKLEVYDHNSKAISFYKKNKFYIDGPASEKSKYMIKLL